MLSRFVVIFIIWYILDNQIYHHIILACLVNTTKELFNEISNYGSLWCDLDRIEVV